MVTLTSVFGGIILGAILTAQGMSIHREVDPTHPAVLYVRDRDRGNRLFLCLPAAVSSSLDEGHP